LDAMASGDIANVSAQAGCWLVVIARDPALQVVQQTSEKADDTVTSVSTIIDLADDIGELSGNLSRVGQMMSVLDEDWSNKNIGELHGSVRGGDELSFQNVSAIAPSGAPARLLL
jgi:hypothetical protein